VEKLDEPWQRARGGARRWRRIDCRTEGSGSFERGATAAAGAAANLLLAHQIGDAAADRALDDIGGGGRKIPGVGGASASQAMVDQSSALVVAEPLVVRVAMPRRIGFLPAPGTVSTP